MKTLDTTETFVEYGYCNYCKKSGLEVMQINFDDGFLIEGHSICDECLCRNINEEVAEREAQIRDAGLHWCDCCEAYVHEEFMLFYDEDMNDIMVCYECTEIE